MMLAENEPKKSIFLREGRDSVAPGKKNDLPEGRTRSVKEKEENNNDYWNRIAEDPASGYKNDDSDTSLLNADQLPDDHKRGDQP